MRAVLKDGLRVIARSVGKDTDAARAALTENMQWVRSVDTDYPFAFVVICEELGLNAEYVRERVERSVANGAVDLLKRRRIK